MSGAVAVQDCLNREGLFGGLLAFHSDTHQMFGRQNDSVSPLDMLAVTGAADEANIASHNFGDDVRYKVFFQPKRIGRARRLFLHSHFRLLPRKSLANREYGLSGRTRKLLCEHNVQHFVAAKPRVEQRPYSRNRFQILMHAPVHSGGMP